MAWNPPITRWDSDRRSGDYEYGLVLFTLLHQGAVMDKKAEAKEARRFFEPFPPINLAVKFSLTLL